MFHVLDHGTHVTCERSADERLVTSELYALDPDLFLTEEPVEGGSVYVVKLRNGDRDPIPVTYWSDPVTNEPWPLTTGIIDKVKTLEGGWGTVRERVERHNHRIREEARAELRYAAAEAAGDVFPRVRETRSAVLHRGVGLRMARDRRRARGEKC